MTDGCSLLLEVASRRILRAEGEANVVTAPGSTLKPFALAALMEAGKLRANERLVCPGELTIGGRLFGCVHPAMAAPMTIEMAIAYSCNSFVAHVAERFAPGELSRYLAHVGFQPARLRAAASPIARQLQALGNGDVLVTPHDLLFAYHHLALRAHGAILEGLEGAVAYGTAQRAQVQGVTVAGKTGTAPGNAAWFAGFAPSRKPKAVVVVLAGGRSGGADAAPAGSRMLTEYLR